MPLRILSDLIEPGSSGGTVWVPDHGVGTMRELTLAEIRARAHRLAAALESYGLTPGSPGAVVASAGPHGIVATFALWCAGASVLLLDSTYSDAALSEGLGRERVRFVLVETPVVLERILTPLHLRFARWCGLCLLLPPAALSLLLGSASAAAAEAARVLSLSYSFAQPTVERQAGKARVTVSDCDTFERVGEPSLPFRTARILLPPGFTLTTVSARVPGPPITLPGLWELERGQKLASPGKSADRPDEPDAPATAERPAPLGSSSRLFQPAQLVSVQRLLGCDVALVRLFPVEYRATNGTLHFSARLDVSLALSPYKGKSVIALPARDRAGAPARVELKILY